MTLRTVFSQKGIPPRYGLDDIPADISRRELLAHFSYDGRTREFISGNCRLYPSRVVLGLQIGSYRMIGRFQQQPEAAPSTVIRHVARALKLEGEFVPLEYTDRGMTRWEHIQMAQKLLGLSNFPPRKHQSLIDRLSVEAHDLGHIPDWIKAAEDILRAEYSLFPTVKVLKRLIATARDKSLAELVGRINAALGEEARLALENLLLPTGADGGGETKWSELTDKDAYRSTPEKLNNLLARIKLIRGLPPISAALSGVSEGHMRYLSQRGMHQTARQLGQHSHDNRRAIMCATLRELEAELTDVVVQMNDEILTGVFLRGRTRADNHYRECRATVRSVVSAFKAMSDALLDDSVNPAGKISMIDKAIPRAALRELREAAERLDTPRVTAELLAASRGIQSIQKYLPNLLEIIEITSTSKKDTVLEGLAYYLKRRRDGKGGIGDDAPTGFVNDGKWRKAVFDADGKPQAMPWILCLADRLRGSIRQGSLEVAGTRQYKSIDSDLVPWKEWKAWKDNPKRFDLELPFTSTAEQVVTPLFKVIKELSGGHKRWIDEGTAEIDAKNRLHLKKLEKIEVPDSVERLRGLLHKRMPPRSLPEMYLEADRLTGFSSQLTRISSGKPVATGESPWGEALYAALHAITCNIPLTQMESCSGIPYDRLMSIHDEVIRPQTVRSAMAAMVDFYSKLPLARVWGTGSTSSSDGQGFPAEGKPLGSFYNKRRFHGRKMGTIIYTHIADNNAPFYVQVLPGGAREATYVLDGLLYHGTMLLPHEHYTDSHGFTDIVFAVLYLLGIRLAPRIAGIPDSTLWFGRGYETECPGLFDGSISLESIFSQWDAMQRFMLTIQTGKTRASQLIRKISAMGRKHPLHKAFRNLGRLLRTRHILEMAGNPIYRRRTLQGLNKGESRNSLAAEVRYAKRGAFQDKDPEMQLCSASALNLAILCVAVCNTVDMQKAIRELKREGHEVSEDDLRFFSPYAHGHHNLYGQFSFRSIPGIHTAAIERAFEPI